MIVLGFSAGVELAVTGCPDVECDPNAGTLRVSEAAERYIAELEYDLKAVTSCARVVESYPCIIEDAIGAFRRADARLEVAEHNRMDRYFLDRSTENLKE